MPGPISTPRAGGALAVDPLQPWTRPRSLHWVARLAALASLFVAGIWRWAAPADSGLSAMLVALDVALCLFFAVEFFTRSGWNQFRLQYARWRWFDLLAVIPITAIGPVAITAIFWLVFACRAIRLVDRSLGDGYVARSAAALVSGIEEEVSDRILSKMLSRWDQELLEVDFGAAVAGALRRNQRAVLQRVFAEQLKEGPFARVAQLTGLKGGIEKEETRLFNALTEMVGSPEVDAAIRDVLSASLQRARQGLNTRSWRRDFAEAANPANRPNQSTPARRSSDWGQRQRPSRGSAKTQ